MIQKISIGVFFATILGMFITSMFVSKDASLSELIFTKITATTIITGVFCGIYASFSKSKLQIFLISIGIGLIVFYAKYLITGHHFDPVTMGAFVGAILGTIFAGIKKIAQSITLYNSVQKLKRVRKRFSN
ncbi:hypothetical protein DUT90_11150 [Polaribacter sp. WD7]|uniref:hypothetical protein n=1 Tax=Polaribacter sp. WD7 TaxID=2269061 RepID=UPI000DF11E81|nr:hypothetical protein [Polaribacter sp. WD7]RCS26320.1 hypothetical protein DUT90_11150 [Polaribacter sp. WD7]